MRAIYLSPSHFSLGGAASEVRSHRKKLVLLPNTGQIMTSCDFKWIQTKPSAPLPTQVYPGHDEPMQASATLTTIIRS